MFEVFKKELLTSREFPVIFMAAEGLLFFREGETVHVPHLVADICLQLRERGYRLAVVSNWKVSLQALLRDHLLLDFFDLVLTASDVGAEKPSPLIFEVALEDLSVLPKEAVFVGPSWLKDIEGARKAGMRAILYDPELREMKALGMQTADVAASGVPRGSRDKGEDKVVELSDLRVQKKLDGVMVIRRFEELLDIFQ